MKLTIRRNQMDVKGLFGGHKGVRFSLYGKCDILEGERALIDKYKVGDYVLADYEVPLTTEKLTMTVTVNGILNGQTVETGNINTLLDLEKSMKQGCQNLKNLLDVMKTFGGEEKSCRGSFNGGASATA
ncbi:MAG TPA: hypothetical protein VH280_05545, partial [Verrucomicrobiae bacterium]|nr:hypothetical protein [Verrucomicrobiae bacterium]